jgi:hypothetical protein
VRFMRLILNNSIQDKLNLVAFHVSSLPNSRIVHPKHVCWECLAFRSTSIKIKTF